LEHAVVALAARSSRTWDRLASKEWTRVRFRAPEFFLGALLTVAVFAVGLQFSSSFHPSKPPKVYVLEKSESHARASLGFLEKIADDPTVQFTAFLAGSTLLLWWATWRIGVRQSKEAIILQRAYVSVEPLGVHFGNVQ
jgi:hypothetical protein